MSTKLSVFVISVQKDLEVERVIVQNLLHTDGGGPINPVQAEIFLEIVE